MNPLFRSLLARHHILRFGEEFCERLSHPNFVPWTVLYLRERDRQRHANKSSCQGTDDGCVLLRRALRALLLASGGRSKRRLLTDAGHQQGVDPHDVPTPLVEQSVPSTGSPVMDSLLGCAGVVVFSVRGQLLGLRSVGGKTKTVLFCCCGPSQADWMYWMLHRWSVLAQWEVARTKRLHEVVAFAQTLGGGFACVRNVRESVKWAKVLMQCGILLGDDLIVRKCKAFIAYGYLWSGEKKIAKRMFQAQMEEARQVRDDIQFRRCYAAVLHIDYNPEYENLDDLKKVRGEKYMEVVDDEGDETLDAIWTDLFADGGATAERLSGTASTAAVQQQAEGVSVVPPTREAL